MAGGAALGGGRGLGAVAAVWEAGKGKLRRKERVAESQVRSDGQSASGAR